MDLDHFHQTIPVITTPPQLDTEKHLSQNVFEKCSKCVFASIIELHKRHGVL